MATILLQVEGETAWELNHCLPVLWPWFFEPASITESRRLHSTVFEAADRFHRQVARTAGVAWAGEIAGLFEEVRAEQFFRSLGCSPDAILSMDLAELERARPYNHERASEAWERFFAVCAEGDGKGAGEAWEFAVLSPLVLTGSASRMRWRWRPGRRSFTSCGRSGRRRWSGC
jgi:hypothetical protein